MPWTTTTNHGRPKSITGQAGTKRSRAERGQVVSRAKAKSVTTNMREFLSWAQKHYRIDATASSRTQDGLAGICRRGPRWMHRVFSQRLDGAFHEVPVQDLRYRSKGRTSSATTRPSYMFSSRHGPQGGATHTQKTYCVDWGTYIDSVPREIYNALEATHSAFSNHNEGLADRVTRDTTITKQQIDLATRMMQDKISRLPDGDYEQSLTVQLFLDCVDRATASSTAIVSFREQPMHVKDNQTLNLKELST